MPHPIDLRSDTVTRPSPGMREAMARAVVGDDVFEDDPTAKELEALAAELTGRQAGLFVPSGTMGNEVALLAHTRRGDEAILDSNAHIYKYEVAGPAVLSGVQLAPLMGERGLLSAAQIEAAIRDDDIHQPVTRVICLENTHNRAGGVIHPVESMREIRALADRRGIRIHLDGARIFNAAAASCVGVKAYCALCDSVMFCLSKGLGAPIGSMVVGDADFILLARRYRKMLGGGMRQVGIIAAAGVYALKHNVARLSEDHARARRLAEAIAKIPSLTIDLDTVQTNIVVIGIGATGMGVEECVAALEKQGLLVVPFGRARMRAVTHLDVDDADIAEAVSIFERVFAKV